MRHFAIQRDGFDGPVRLEHNGAARGFVTTARLHAHVAVFDDVRPANAVGAPQGVEPLQHSSGRETLVIDGHDVTLAKGQLDVLRFVRRRFWRHAPAPHVFLGFSPGLFQHAPLIGDMQQIGVHRIGRFFLLAGEIDGYRMLGTIGHQGIPRSQIPLSPGRNHLDTGL